MIPNRGTALCAGTTRSGRPCCDREIRGIGYCLHHVPDDRLEEAEQIAGFRRCRRGPGGPYSCKFYALGYVDDPPGCRVHVSGFMRRIEYIRHRDRVLRDRKGEIMAAMQAGRDGDHDLAVALMIGGDQGREYLRAVEGGAGDD